MPILLFAVAFGLSTDYGVFLLSRIKEARDAGASDSECIAIGLERTGRIVTAAALLFAIAIGAFATSQIIFIKQNGIGTALAVLIDATIIRALLVPSLMELLGAWNWWAPKPLRWLHYRFGFSESERRTPRPGRPDDRGLRLGAGGSGYAAATMTIATAMFLIAAGAILRYAINVDTDVIDIETVGLILMIAGGAGLALSLLYELVQTGDARQADEYPQQRSGYDDPTRRL